MSMRTPSLLAAIVVSGTLLTGCSLFSGDSDSADTSADTSVAADSQSIRRVSPADAEAVIEDGDVVVLDVRTPEEFAQNHLADAENLDYYNSEFPTQLDQLDKNKTYVMYCQTGNRSASVADIMRKQGFTDVVEIDGGITRWQTEGLPIDRG